jgi:hypothetical protein
MTVFAQNFRLLTQQNHNHNNEITAGEPTSRPFPAPHPQWLGLTDNSAGFANGNYELFPRVAPATLSAALNPFEMNLVPADPERGDALLFVYETAPGTTPVMSAVHYNGTWMRISNLQNSVGTAPAIDDSDTNPNTGVALALIPAAIAGAVLLVSKKRKD